MKKIIIFITTLLIIIVGLVLYSYFIGTKGLKTNEIKIEVSNLNDSYNGFKVVHFSDLHYGRTVNEEDLTKIVDEINLLKADIVVFTGDLLDGSINLDIEDYNTLSSLLLKIDSNIGKYAISGNHDIDDKWEKTITDGGFINLNDTYQLIYTDVTPIIISGISSNLNSTLSINDKVKPINDYINSMSVKPEYSILLIHEPDYVDSIDTTNFNLILAGHSHGGQVRLPFIGATLLPNGAKIYYNEYYKINNSKLYISSGLGTSIVNFRLLNKPSINFYRIVKEAN